MASTLRLLALFALLSTASFGVVPPAHAQQEVEVRIWLEQGLEPVLARGERTRIYYHVSEDAYVAIFHVDTNGTVRLLSPASPGEAERVRGGRDYRLIFARSPYWFVDDDPGVGYFFALASPFPFDFSAFRYSPYQGGWDLAPVGRRVYRDPHLAMDDFTAAMIPDWEYVPYALDFTSYQVGGVHDYPRFICYDCHVFRPYSSWNPYLSYCTSFRVIVYSDPYYYPATRYRGTRVVYVRPPAVGQPRYVFRERVPGESGAPVYAPRGGSALPPTERRVTPGVGNPEGPPRRGEEADTPASRALPTLQRRPSTPPRSEAPPSTEPSSRTPAPARTPAPGRTEPPARTPAPVRAPTVERDRPAGGTGEVAPPTRSPERPAAPPPSPRPAAPRVTPERPSPERPSPERPSPERPAPEAPAPQRPSPERREESPPARPAPAPRPAPPPTPPPGERAERPGAPGVR